MGKPGKRRAEGESQRDAQRFSEGDKRKADEENPEDNLADAPESEDTDRD